MERIVLGVEAVLAVLRSDIGGCREDVPYPGDKCWASADYVLWGKLIPAEGLGPRCYEHARKHVGDHALASRSGYALLNLRDLALDVANASLQVAEPDSYDPLHGIS